MDQEEHGLYREWLNEEGRKIKEIYIFIEENHNMLGLDNGEEMAIKKELMYKSVTPFNAWKKNRQKQKFDEKHGFQEGDDYE